MSGFLGLGVFRLERLGCGSQSGDTDAAIRGLWSGDGRAVRCGGFFRKRFFHHGGATLIARALSQAFSKLCTFNLNSP
jgi:hypothetical protein